MEYCRIVLHALIVILVILSTKGQLQPFCELPAERGPCNKLELRYRFSEESEYCQTFLYGGCEGNRNNFKTIEECVKTCVDEPVPNCELPKDPGSCFQTNKVRYFFDENTERCEKFYFSGCQGNKNNFETEEECRTTCGALPPLATESPKSASNGNNGWVNPTSIPSGINGFTLVDNNPNAPSPKQGDEGWKNSNNNNVNNNNNNNNNNNQNSNGNENLSGGFNRSWQSSSLSTTAQSKTWAQNLRQRWNDSINGRSPGDTPGNSGWNTSSNPKQANNSWNSNNAGGNNQSNNQWNSNNNASYQNKNGWNNWNNVSNNNNKSWNTQQRTKWNSNNSNNNWKNNQQNGWNSKPGWNSWNNKGTDNKNGNAGQSTGNRQTGIITNIWNPNSKGPSNVQNTWNKNGNSNQKNTWNQNQQSQWNNNKWQSMKAQGNKWQGSSVGGDANKVGLSNSQPNQKVSNSNNQNQPMGRRSWHSNNSQNNNKWQSGNKNQAQNQQWNSNNKGWSKNPTPGVGNQHTSNNKARSPVSNTANSWQKMQHEQNQNGNAKDKPTLPPVQFIGNVGMQRTIVQRNTMTNGKAFNLKEAPVAKEMLHGVHKASQYPPGNSNAFSRRNSFVPPPNQHQANHQTQKSQFNSFGGGPGPKRWHSMKNAGNSWNVNTHHSKNSNNMGKFDANQNKHSFVSGQNQNWRGNGLSQQTNTANYQQNNQNNAIKNNVGANSQHQYQTNNNFKSWRSNQQATPNHSNPPGHPPVTNQLNQNNPGNQNPSGTQWNPNHSNAVKHPQGITQWNSNSPNTGQPLNKPQGITQWNSNRPNTGQPLNQPQGNNQWNSKTQNPSNPSNKQSVHRQWNSNNQNQNNYMKHNTGHNQWQINNQNPRNAAKHSTGQNQWNNNQKNSGKPAQPPSGHDKWNHNAQSPSSNANHQTGHNKWKSEIPNQRSHINQPPPPSSKWNTNPNPSNSLKHPPEKNQWKSNNPNTFKSAQKPQQPPGRNKWNGNKPNQNWSSLKTPSGNDKMNSQNLGSSSKPSPENVKWNKNSQKDWSNKPHQSNQQNMQGNTRNLNSWNKKAPDHSQMNSTTHFHSQNSSVPQNFARQGPSNLNSNQMKNPSPRQPYNQWNTHKHGNNYKLNNQGIPNSGMKNQNGFSKEAITGGNRQSANWNQNKDGVNTIQKKSNVSKGWNSQVRNNSLDQQTLPKDPNWGGNTWNRRPAENPTMLPGVAHKGQNSMTISHMSDIKKFPDSTPDPVLNWKTPESSGFDRFHPEVLTSKMDVRRTKIKASEKVKPTQTVDGNGAFVLPMSGSSNKEGTHPSPKPTVVIHAVDICLQGKNVGRCKGYEPSYYHNKETKQCELFIYSGCGGNSNLFYSRADCEQTCHVERLPVCDQPRDTGTCAAHRVKYFYNKATKSCEEFTYTGCEGNDNRFDSMEQCEATCTFKTLCELPKDVGPCQRWEPRYWYNPSKKECEVFYFGGCHGNKNNFRDITSCRKHCVSRLR